MLIVSRLVDDAVDPPGYLLPIGNFVGCIQTSVVVDRGRSLLDAENTEDLNLNDCPVA